MTSVHDTTYFKLVKEAGHEQQQNMKKPPEPASYRMYIESAKKN